MKEDKKEDNVIRIKEKLHPLEVKIVPLLKERVLFYDVVKKSGLKEVEVMRALQWLENKKAIKLEKTVKKYIILGENGLKALKNGLPERRLLVALFKKNLYLDEAKKEAKLNDEELNIAIGILSKKRFIEIKKEEKGKNILSITAMGKTAMKKKSLEEQFLEKLGKKKVDLDNISPEEKFAIDALLKRKDMIRSLEVKQVVIMLTEIGKQLSKMKIEKMEDSVSVEDLKTGKWREKRYRAYDVSINVPEIYGGRKHFITEGVEYIKKIWLEMGFKEMYGDIVQSAFWDLDVLFVPQDHPAREMQDTFFLQVPETTKIKDRKLFDRVKAVHENGSGVGSKGWGYSFSEEEASRLLLRTHTTVLSAKTIASLKKSELPAKFFSVNSVFRNEALDWKHLFEFMQIEGIVVDRNATFNNLVWYLKEFFRKMGYEKIRLIPSHFPYTEPSVEVEVFDEDKKEWIEFGGAGIFRPEVVVPLFGEDVPVLAWGLGLERILKEPFNISDIREFYKNDIAFLRKRGMFIR